MDMLLQALGFAFALLPWFIYVWFGLTVFFFMFDGWNHFNERTQDGFWHIFNWSFTDILTNFGACISLWVFVVWMNVIWLVDPLLLVLVLSGGALAIFKAFFIRVRLAFFVKK